MIISIWSTLFFKEGYELDKEATELLGDAEQNIDGKGNTLLQFLRDEILINFLIYGKSSILVSAPGYQVQSKGQEKELKLRAFFNAVHPLALVDWARVVDEANTLNELKYARYEYEQVSDRNSETDEPKLVQYTDALKLVGGSLLITRYAFEAAKGQDGKVTSEWIKKNDILTKLNVLPLSIIESDSWVTDLAEECLRYHNSRSCYDNVVYNQAYQRVAYTGVKDEEKKNYKVVGESTVSFFANPQANILQVEPIDAGTYERAVEDAKNNVFKIGLNQVRSLPSSSKESESQESKAEDKENSFALITSVQTHIESICNQALKHYAAIMGNDNFNGKITINKEFTDVDWQQFITTYQAFKSEFDKVPVIKKGATKKALLKLGLDKTDEQQGIKDLANLETEPVEDPKDDLEKIVSGANV
jgi:hypothetical protein